MTPSVETTGTRTPLGRRRARVVVPEIDPPLCPSADDGRTTQRYVDLMRLLRVSRGVIERHPFASDALVAIAAAAIVQADIWGDDGYLSASNWIYVPTGLLMTLPLAWRRRAPLTVVAIVMGALAVEAL